MRNYPIYMGQMEKLNLDIKEYKWPRHFRQHNLRQIASSSFQYLLAPSDKVRPAFGVVSGLQLLLGSRWYLTGQWRHFGRVIHTFQMLEIKGLWLVFKESAEILRVGRLQFSTLTSDDRNNGIKT